MHGFPTNEERQQEKWATERLAAQVRRDKQASAIVCRLAADQNIDPELANALARQFGKSLEKRFIDHDPSAFGELPL